MLKKELIIVKDSSLNVQCKYKELRRIFMDKEERAVEFEKELVALEKMKTSMRPMPIEKEKLFMVFYSGKKVNEVTGEKWCDVSITDQNGIKFNLIARNDGTLKIENLDGRHGVFRKKKWKWINDKGKYVDMTKLEAELHWVALENLPTDML